MGSADRTKKRELLRKKAILHFSLCFVMGFFSGFAPSSTSTDAIFSGKTTTTTYQPIESEGFFTDPTDLNRNLMAQSTADATTTDVELDTPRSRPTSEGARFEELDGDRNSTLYRKLLIIVTTTRSNDPFKITFLRRLGHTLKLVPPPLLWIVVEPRSEATRTAEMLRMTGIMYRHLAFSENFTDVAAEIDHQRNIALNHIEHHRLDGVVHFADLSNVYDLRFFDQIRDIEAFGTWPVAWVSTNRKRVMIEGPVCNSSEVVGWHLKDPHNGNNIMSKRLSSFAFNSSILWDPERWGRSSSNPDSSQDSIRFVQQVVLDDESNLMVFPSNCSLVMVWHVHVPRSIFPAYQVDSSRTTFTNQASDV